MVRVQGPLECIRLVVDFIFKTCKMKATVCVPVLPLTATLAQRLLNLPLL